ncbi:endo alpha-1,4 polygalactosaminidase [Mucilaginibacter gracilis]|nr:endo alpha-1,4 polygalactosaminidase [Mucilaginibacter gracilis]
MKINSFLLLSISFLACLIACKKGTSNDDVSNPIDSTQPVQDKTDWWKPVTGTSFDWQLDDVSPGNNFAAAVVDVDAFTTSAETVVALHAKGKKVIAYISVGTIESDRPDANLVPAKIIGNVYPEWPKEKWLDIRQIDQLKPWLNSRINMILKKGFDGIEPDNLDSYDNEPGFDISERDVKKYSDYLITLAHASGLAIGQKNVKELTPDFAAKFDFVITEDAFKEGWHKDVEKYITLNKPVFAVEYTDKMSQKDFESNVCPAAKQLKYTTILKKRDLTAWVDNCK